MQEKWLPVVGFEGHYEVSDQGRVRSLPRRVPYGTKSTIGRSGRILAPYKSGTKGHLGVQLQGGPLHRRAKLHHLVLEAFIGPRPDGMIGLHNDGDPTNNEVSNLRWGTYSDNMLDSVQHGTNYWAKRTHCKHGHELDGLVLNDDGSVKQRYCKTCHRSRRPKKTRCPNGHEYDTIRHYPDGTERPYCAQCQREKMEHVYAAKRSKAHCPHGHLLDGVQNDKNGRPFRYCKTCKRLSAARRRAEKKNTT